MNFLPAIRSDALAEIGTLALRWLVTFDPFGIHRTSF
jgi:hypothetical protein